MTEYGDFISKGPYVSGALTSVDIAVAKDGRAGRLALKRFHPPPSSQMLRALFLEAWRTSLERQQRAARAGGAALEVMALGSYPEGEYAVFPWKHRSLLSIVTAVSPTGDRLRSVAAGVLSALKSWEQHYGRAHGNLKATNVFVIGEGPLQSLDFVLSDPAWRPGISVEAPRRQELAQLGALLVQMVRGREAGGAPVEDAPEWRRLGRAGLAWRDYSNFLLDSPSASADVASLEGAVIRLQAIPRDFRPARLAVRGGAGVTLLLCGAAVGYARMGNPRTMPERLLWLAEKIGNPRGLGDESIPKWGELCHAWEDWLADLAASSSLEQTRELWIEPADPLRVALVAFHKDPASLRPDHLIRAETEGRSFASLAKNPPPSVRDDLVVAVHVTKAWKVVSDLQGALAAWPRWKEMRFWRDELNATGKKDAVYALQLFVPDLPALGTKADPQTAFRALSSLARSPGARALLNQTKAWQKLSEEMQKSGDRIQMAMPLLALQAITDTRNVGELANSIAAASSELDRRRRLVLGPNVARDRLLKESPLFAESTPVVPADVERWESEVALFSYLRPEEDPRSEVKWDDDFRSLNSVAGELEGELPTAETTPSAPFLTRAEYDVEAKRLETDVITLRATAAVHRDLADLRRQTRRTQDRMKFLEDRVKSTVEQLRPEPWLARVERRTWPYAAAQQRWVTWRSEHVGSVSAAALQQNPDGFHQLRKDERKLRDWLAALDGPAGLGSPPTITAASAEIKTALEKLDTTFREDTVTKIVATSTWKNTLPTYTFEEMLKPQKAPLHAVEQYREWTARLPEFATHLEQLRVVLSQGVSWSEGVADLLDRLNHHEGVKTLEGAPQSWLHAAQRLRELATTHDLELLATAITGGDLASGRTAWKRLGDLPEWPADAVQLSREVEFGAALRAELAKLPPNPRRDAWTAELDAGQRERWLRLARLAVRQPSQVEGVFSQAAGLGVTVENLDPAMAYDVRLWELLHRVQTAADLSELRTARDRFIAAVNQLAGMREQEGQSAFLKAVESAPLEDEGSSAKIHTPRVAGWKEESSEDGKTLVARWARGGHTLALEYRLIESTDGSDPFFLARRTLAVGEFLELLATSPEKQKILDAMPGWARNRGSAPRDVVMAWQPAEDGTGPKLNRSWFSDPPSPSLKAELEGHHPELEPALIESPTARSPLQYISPEAAKKIAEDLLGARLPTPAEWKALCQHLDSPPQGVFRAGSFEQVWKYTESRRYKLDDGNGEITLAWRPTTGAFLPSPEGVNTPDLSRHWRVWTGTKHPSLWPASVDEGPITSGIIHLFGNIWVYLYDEHQNEYYVAGGSILAPPSADILHPQRIPKSNLTGARVLSHGDGFTDVGFRAAFDAPASVRERLRFFRLVSTQPFITK